MNKNILKVFWGILLLLVDAVILGFGLLMVMFSMASPTGNIKESLFYGVISISILGYITIRIAIAALKNLKAFSNSNNEEANPTK